MIKCKVCGCEFTPVAERHYIARDNGKIGVVAAFQSNNEEKLYDAFDCLVCGCQVVAQERKRVYVPCVASEDMEEEKDDD